MGSIAFANVICAKCVEAMLSASDYKKLLRYPIEPQESPDGAVQHQVNEL